MGKTVIITDEQRELVKTMASENAEDFSIARALGVTKRMLHYRCQKELAWGRGVAIQNGLVPPSKARHISTREEVSEETKFQIQVLAELGLPIEHIATVVGMAVMTLNAYCKEIIDEGRANGHKKVASALFDMAIDKEHPAMTTFYLKAKAGWKETTSVEFPDANGVPQKVVGDQFNLNISTEKMQILIAALNEKV